MGQSNFRWVIIFGDGTTVTIVSTPADIPNMVDFTMDIASIVRVELE
ncbi:hypothetical protein LCGC14_2619030 [marine sediment metagenome]|uniref:Uncharacterized protein n=1 Tax=marine sediment metagenome TaxID=412755 RepID=A0A0F9A3K4_9ZZZZ